MPPHRLLRDSELVIIEWPSNGHDGGDLGFGPDGFLYFPTGDGTSDSDGDLTGQSMNDLLAAMVRIDVDHPANGKPYSVPRDNPFVDLAGAQAGGVGLRLPQSVAHDVRSAQRPIVGWQQRAGLVGTGLPRAAQGTTSAGVCTKGATRFSSRENSARHPTCRRQPSTRTRKLAR